ncbi:hypothetical protein [Streptomyces mobaraensis]|uniref:Uncharacterized protein n=1 Tax=Streptomyces mobaraensis TaxID=35621 RepID=A0A5N5WD01_STRMB|nr:hypothetical protein [Streptomyces mobaraensis]KAB7850153.1 hypothetical protein FRZ00_06020 [Streptomyces mobaraensis]
MEELKQRDDGWVTTGDVREVLVEIRGPVAEAARVRAWITAASGSLTGAGIVVADVVDDDVPGWTRCRMTVVGTS